MDSSLTLNTLYRKLDNNNVIVNGTSYVIHLMAPPGASSWYSSASHHVVLFAKLESSQSYHWVVFKLMLAPSILLSTHEARPMTPNELTTMQKRYALLEQFCMQFQAYNPYDWQIWVNKPVIVTVNGMHVWMEDYLPKFRKFWGNASSQMERMVTSASPTLSLLQYFIYDQSRQSYTVVDLQGVVQQDKYILCDVEFSDTLSSFPDLFNSYLYSFDFASTKLNGLARVSLKNNPTSSVWHSQFDTLDTSLAPETKNDDPSYNDPEHSTLLYATSCSSTSLSQNQTSLKLKPLVWISRKGHRYHKTHTCFRNSGSILQSVKKSKASAQGYTPCRKCFK